MSGRRSSSFGENPSSKQRQWLHYCQHLHKVENMYATFLVVTTPDGFQVFPRSEKQTEVAGIALGSHRFKWDLGRARMGVGQILPPSERVLGMKEVAFCPQPPPGSDHNSRNLIIVWVLYFSDELSSLLLLSTKLRINGRGLMVWNIQVSEWPCPNALCNAGLVELECRANICSRAIRGKKRTCVTWELIFDQIQAFRPVPPRVI